MRILILLFILIFNAYLYAQDTNAVNNNIPANASENAIMQINRFDARRNPVSFINLVNFTPYYVLREYARVNNIEIYPYDTESSLRARIIERQVNIKQEVIKSSDEIKEVARTTINRGGAQVELIGADFAERYTVDEAEEELISLYGNVTMKMYNNTLIADRVVYSLKTGEVFASGIPSEKDKIDLQITNICRGLSLLSDDKYGAQYVPSWYVSLRYKWNSSEDKEENWQNDTIIFNAINGD